MTKRKEWHNIWADLALSIAQRSTDEKHKVGTVIVSSDNQRVLSVGYNGDHKGGSNKRRSQEHGKSGFIHAENNALIKLNPLEPCKKIMYVTLSPCYACAQLIINSGIDEVYYIDEYHMTDGIELLKEMGIKTKQL